MSMKVGQVMSEELSVRKRRARDHLFKKLGYRCLLPRYVAHSKDQKVVKRNETVEARSKILKRREEGDIDTANWGTSDVTGLCKQICNTRQAVVILFRRTAVSSFFS